MQGQSKPANERPGNRWRMLGWSGAALLLLVPFVAMQFTGQVDWSAADFLVFGAMLAITGLAFHIASVTVRPKPSRSEFWTITAEHRCSALTINAFSLRESIGSVSSELLILLVQSLGVCAAVGIVFVWIAHALLPDPPPDPALAGIEVRNSILFADFAKNKVHHGMDIREAVVQAGQIRMRPIVVTQLTLMAGAGAIMFDPIFQGMAISLAAGVLVSTILTLIVIPLGTVKARDALYAVAGVEPHDRISITGGGTGGGPAGSGEPAKPGKKLSDRIIPIWSAFISILFAVIGGAMLLAILVLGGIMDRTIIQKIEHLSEKAQELSMGKGISKALPFHERDELGSLAHGIDRLRNSLNRLMRRR